MKVHPNKTKKYFEIKKFQIKNKFKIFITMIRYKQKKMLKLNMKEKNLKLMKINEITIPNKALLKKLLLKLS